MKIVFHCPLIDERGTTRATLDYAHFNETLLGNRSIILTRADQPAGPFVDRADQRFRMITYRTPADIDAAVSDADAFYILTHGDCRRVPVHLPANCWTIVHCVFRATTPCGDVYASISEWVNQRSRADRPVVPHMVHLPETEGDLREGLGIPADAPVIGRHGGPGTFDLQFVHRAIARALREREDLRFLFLNTREFLPPNERVIHLPVGGPEQVSRFIDTCDAMLHARRDGETFGLAVGEFSVRNKPVITWSPPTGLRRTLQSLANRVRGVVPGWQRLRLNSSRAHLDILGDKAILYRSGRDLSRILRGFAPRGIDPVKAAQRDRDAYSETYSPEAVMALFDRHFLEGARSR